MAGTNGYDFTQVIRRELEFIRADIVEEFGEFDVIGWDDNDPGFEGLTEEDACSRKTARVVLLVDGFDGGYLVARFSEGFGYRLTISDEF